MTSEVSNILYEIHPERRLADGGDVERFLKEVDNFTACNILYDPSHFILQQLDYCPLSTITQRISGDVPRQDAEFPPNGKKRIYGGFKAGSTDPVGFARLAMGSRLWRYFSENWPGYGFDAGRMARLPDTGVVDRECALETS